MVFGYSVTYTKDKVATGENEQVFAPRTPRTGTCGVVLLHGSGNPKAFVDSVAQKSSVKMAAALAGAGIPCIAGDFGNQSWGNETVVSRIDAAWAYLRTLYPTMRSDKICLVGGSMGAAGAIHYAQDFPAKVAAIVGLIPLTDVISFYNANIGGAASQVASAWGVANGAALPAHADLIGRASLSAAVPTLLGYSTVDTTVLPAWVEAYAAAIGITPQVIDTQYGHSDTAIGLMPIPTIGTFLADHGA